MPEAAGVPWWLWLIVALVSVAVLAAAGYFGWRWVWYKLSRRYLVSLIGRRENTLSSLRTLEAVMRHLADESADQLMEFAQDPEAEDRKALTEVAQRMTMLADELWTMPLPKRLWPAGEALGDAAATIGEEAAHIHDLLEPEKVLVALGEIDLARAESDFERADRLVNEAAEYYDVEDAAVYGGGLYI